MKYTILSVNTDVSVVKLHKRTKIITDTMIQSKVGIITYRLLYYNRPQLYKRFKTCTDSYRKRTIYTNTETIISNLDIFFIDTNYTPINLKEDLIRIIIGAEPINSDAKMLIGSSVYNNSDNTTILDIVIIIIVMIITSFIISWFLFIRNYNNNIISMFCKHKQ